MRIEQSSARLEYDWGHFAGYRETENLILLYLSSFAYFMIPKRAFDADPARLAVFKGMVMNGIPEGHFLPSPGNAFPVLPMAVKTTVPATPPAPPANPLSNSERPL